ncbi:MAG: exodeoxyribonuclease III [Cyclobacteriaceae bacterium]
MKIISYNVNGIRSAVNKGLLDWLQHENPDIVCLQETKAQPEQINTEDFKNLGYHSYWHSAEKKGYSGVAILSKPEPLHVEYGCGIPAYDFEGRVIRADYLHYSVMCVYMPSGSSGDIRQDFKMQWLFDFERYIRKLKEIHPSLVIVGDYNICHKPIDIHDPVRNKNSSGFLPEERAWMSSFLELGFIDSFRYFNQDSHHYSWWSYRARAREKNLGWRIDYQMVSNILEKKMLHAAILPGVKHSDHCPVLLELKDA